MLPDWVSNPGPLTYESGALPIALRAPPLTTTKICIIQFGRKHSSYSKTDWIISPLSEKVAQELIFCSLSVSVQPDAFEP